MNHDGNQLSVAPGTLDESVAALLSDWQQQWEEASQFDREATRWNRTIQCLYLFGTAFALVAILAALFWDQWVSFLICAPAWMCIGVGTWLHFYRWAPAANEHMRLIGSLHRFREGWHR